MRIISACIALIFLVFSFVFAPSTLAKSQYTFSNYSDAQLTEALVKNPHRLLPDNPLYVLIWTKEFFLRAFKPSSAKRAEYDLILSGKRVKETYILLDRGKQKTASGNLSRYVSELDRMNAGLAKARSQNQDIASLIDESADFLGQQEIILAAINMRWGNVETDNFQTNFDQSIDAFKTTILSLNQLKPGVKDRFFLTKDIVEKPKEEIKEASPTPSEKPSTSGATPRRIIY